MFFYIDCSNKNRLNDFSISNKVAPAKIREKIHSL
jgi:hypothetical protein